MRWSGRSTGWGGAALPEAGAGAGAQSLGHGATRRKGLLRRAGESALATVLFGTCPGSRGGGALLVAEGPVPQESQGAGDQVARVEFK